jgi:predicted transposase YdaD
VSYDNACKYLAEQVATIPDMEERQNIAGCVEILAGLRFDKDLVRQFLREDIMQESVIYQDIVQKEAFKLISRLLKRRVGDIDESLVEQIRNLSAEQLENLGEALLDFSEITDLVAWLEQQ